jgi:hypothetical protein
MDGLVSTGKYNFPIQYYKTFLRNQKKIETILLTFLVELWIIENERASCTM